MRRHIFVSILLTALVAMLLMSCLIFVVMYGQFYRDMKQTVEKETGIIVEGYKLSGEEYLRRLNAGATRVTLIAPGGTVLFDNLADPASMENHLDRPEVQSALETGTGEAARMSETIGRQTFYRAVRLEEAASSGLPSRPISSTPRLWPLFR
jgi:two-component system phosphate regulon sensor histidine kinase PhoR